MPERAAMPSTPAGMLTAIDRSAAAIEQAFLAAGRGLGAGLSTVEELSITLAGFLGEFQNGRMADASEALDRLSRQLVAVSASLPRDASDLQALAAGTDTITKHLDGLFEQIRMMTIIASSARIEAAVFGEAAGLDSFTREMSTLTDAVRHSVGGCAMHHAAMTERVRRLVTAQGILARDFGDKLMALSRELSDIFAQVSRRQHHACTLTETLAGGSARLAASAGEALIALQGGDAARQRLEHVGTALRIADGVATGADADGDVGSRPVLVAALHRLQAAQLDDLVASFGAEADAIDGMLMRVSADAEALATAGRALLGDGDGTGSFLADFRARLDDAAALIATCGRARQDVARAMEALRADVEQLSGTVSALGSTTLDLIMVGINAGLRAARLGVDGRSLMVIADELKRLAGVITETASSLVTAYEALDAAARKLGPKDDASQTSQGSADIHAITAAFEDTDRRMANFVLSLRERTHGFGAEIGQTRRTFHDTATAVTSLRVVVDELAAQGRQGGEVTEDVARCLATQLWPHYTMARERDIHLDTLGCGPDDIAADGEEGPAAAPDHSPFIDAA